MPNPMMASGALRTSMEPADRYAPVPERYAGSNNPYRGTQEHGVTPTEEPIEPTDWEDGRAVAYEVPPEPPEPIPVRIVSEGARELRSFRTYGAYTGVTGGPARSIVGQDEERSRVTLKHSVDAAVVYISHSAETCNSREGWPLTNGETWSSDTHTEVFAWADSATPLAISVYIDYSVRT